MDWFVVGCHQFNVWKIWNRPLRSKLFFNVRIFFSKILISVICLKLGSSLKIMQSLHRYSFLQNRFYRLGFSHRPPASVQVTYDLIYYTEFIVYKIFFKILETSGYSPLQSHDQNPMIPGWYSQAHLIKVFIHSIENLLKIKNFQISNVFPVYA